MKRSAVTIPLTERLAALSDVLRLRICRLLEAQELSVGELAKVLQAPQSTISRHLRILSDVGLAARRADGTTTYYRLHTNGRDEPLCDLWNTVRTQLLSDAEAGGLAARIETDNRRLQAVLAERKTDSLAYFGRVGGQWDRVRTELFGRHFALHALAALLPERWTVADIGCGTGVTAAAVAPHVREVVCVDASAAMLEAARQRLTGVANVRFVQAAIESLPLPDGQVDAALCLLVLHHVADVVKGLRELRRVLRPYGGRLVSVDMIEHDREVYRSTMGHKHLGFSPERLREMCEQAGFARCTVRRLPSEPDAKGPGLLLAIAARESAGETPAPP